MIIQTQILMLIFAPLLAYVAAAVLFTAIESKGLFGQRVLSNVKSGQ